MKTDKMKIVKASKLFMLVLALVVTCSLQAQENIAEGFYDELVLGNFHLPLGIRFDESGNCFVWEKGGRVYMIDTNGIKQDIPVLDLHEEVMEFRDLGMLGFALHPDYSDNGLVYVLYTVDKHYLLDFGTENYNPDSTIVTEPTISRLARYKLFPTENGLFADPDTRKILIGESLDNGIPMMSNFHGVGALDFGDDGSLLISIGDGGYDVDENAPNPNFAEIAVQEGILKEKEFINFARAQLLDNYNGKILRIDPETGAAYPSNPFYQENDPLSARSKVYALGLRNPYRFFLIPGTGSHDANEGKPGILCIGDVGSGGWEELNIAKDKGANFGWPYFEGNRKQWPQFWTLEYKNLDAANPLFGIAGCDQEYFLFQDLLNEPNAAAEYAFPNPCNLSIPVPDTIPTFVVTRPVISWSNKMWNPPVRTMVKTFNQNGEADEISMQEAGIEGEAFAGFSSIPGFWYESGSMPEEYDHSAFIADYSGWIRSFHFDENMEVDKVKMFREKINGIVDLEFNTHDQAVYYVNINTHELRRIFFGGNPAPVAVLQADKTFGYGDLEIQFDGSESYDPNGLPITYFWDFGDGQFSEEINPQHLYQEIQTGPHSYICTLTVTDSLGATSSDDTVISLNNTPPDVSIISPADNSLYPISAFSWIDLKAEVMDPEHGENELNYIWKVYFHHNSHYHEEPEDTLKSTHLIVDPIGCDEELYWYRIGLEVIDKSGLKGYDEVEIFPDCGESFGDISWVSAKVIQDQIDLIWEDLSFDQKSGYTIEKFGQHQLIENIGHIDIDVSANGTFEIIDTQPFIGKNIYRIKSHHTDGRYDFSKVVQVIYPEPVDFKILPNPNTGICYLKLADDIHGNVDVTIFNIDGKLLKSMDWHIFPGQNHELLLDIQDLSSGIYLVKVNSGEKSEITSIMIAR